MRPPARLKDWLDGREMAAWVEDAPTRAAYQKRLAIWLTHLGRFHAHEIAEMLLVSKQAVWLWVGQYNRKGPEGLARQGRGGRRWGFLSWAQEQQWLSEIEQRALRGEILTAKQLRPELCEATGRDVTLAYVYRLLHRHHWRKHTPRPRHVQAQPERQEAFKKSSRRRSKS